MSKDNETEEKVVNHKEEEMSIVTVPNSKSMVEEVSS